MFIISHSILLEVDHTGHPEILNHIISGKIKQKWGLERVSRKTADWDANDYDAIDWACFSLLNIVISNGPCLGGALFPRLRDTLFHSYDSIALRVRLCLANASSLSPLYSVGPVIYSMFKLWVAAKGETDSELVREATENHLAIFTAPVYHWAFSFASFGSALPECDKFIRDTVTLGTLTAFNDLWDANGHSTLLLTLVKAIAWACGDQGMTHIPRIIARIEKTLLHWLLLLRESGVEIFAYGKWEAKQFSKFRMRPNVDIGRRDYLPRTRVNSRTERHPEYWDHAWCALLYSDGWDRSPHPEHYFKLPAARLQEIRYGPKPEDWRLVWETYEDEWPSQFWTGVEARLQREEALRLRAPGAWIEEEEDIEDDDWDH